MLCPTAVCTPIRCQCPHKSLLYMRCNLTAPLSRITALCTGISMSVNSVQEMTPGHCERRHSSLVQCFWNEIRITITLKHKVFALYGMTLSNMYSRVIAPYENGQVRTFPKTFYLPRYMFSRFRMEMHFVFEKNLTLRKLFVEASRHPYCSSTDLS